jgi:hypothetical protein
MQFAVLLVNLGIDPIVGTIIHVWLGIFDPSCFPCFARLFLAPLFALRCCSCRRLVKQTSIIGWCLLRSKSPRMGMSHHRWVVLGDHY